MSAMALSPGTRLGPYEIVSAIGAGGMGEVYKATDTRLSRTVAIKVLPPHWAADREMTQRFEREAQMVASLNHPNICVLHDVGTADGQGQSPVVFLVMEFLDGETLTERIKRGPIPLDEALDIVIAVTDALDKAHRQGVIHRDLKPSNVMLTPSGPKLLDFGLAKTFAGAQDPAAQKDAAGLSGLTMPGMLIGTLQYMAPEQLEGGDADARTDIFALGVLLHEMVTGKKVFEGKSRVLLMSAIATSEPPPLSSAEPATPPALEHVVRTCLAKIRPTAGRPRETCSPSFRLSPWGPTRASWPRQPRVGSRGCCRACWPPQSLSPAWRSPCRCTCIFVALNHPMSCASGCPSSCRPTRRL